MKSLQNRGTVFPLLALGVFSPLSALHAQTSGTWTTNGPGNWSDGTNWSGGTVASGATAIADFSTLDITGNRTVTVDAPFTIGTLTAQDLTTASHDWTFDGAGPLTLDNGLNQPLITIGNRNTTISAPLAGSNGFTKNGAGALILSGSNSGLSGTMTLENVTGTNNAGVILSSNDAIGGITSIVINGDATNGSYLGIDGGVTLGSGVGITLDSQGGNSFPSGGIRGTGPATDVATIAGPINITRSGSRIANNTAKRLDLTGPITQGEGVTQIFFRFGKNEGVRITNPANSWTATTIHSEETLWIEPGALPLTTSLRICSSGAGTIQTSGTFDRGLGSGAGQVQFALAASRAQGFGARGGDLTLNFGGAGAEVLFDTTPTIAPDTAIRTSLLVLNNSTADGKLTLVNPLNLNGANRTIQVEANEAELTGGLTGTGGLTKSGSGTLLVSGATTHDGATTLSAGTLTFSGAASYTGATTIAGGTLRTTGGDNRLPTGTTLNFSGTSGALELTTASQTLANLTVPNLLAASYTVSGNSLTLDGAVDRQFGHGGAVTNAHSVALDLSDLSSFTSTAPANLFRVGLKAGSTNPGGGGVPGPAVLTLADQNNITANSLRIGDVAASNNGGTSTLRLGRVNTLNVDSINSGASGRSNSNLLFDSGLTDPSVTIRNTDGTSAVSTWNVGQVANFGASTWTDTVNLAGGSSDILVNTLTIGTADIGSQTGRGGTENASFTMGQGTLEATSVNLGRISGTNSSTITSTMAGNGTFTLDHPGGLVKATTVTLATNTMLGGGAGARSVSGTFNLTNGTVEATTIQLGAQTGNATATAAFNWTDGTLRNLTPAGLAIIGLPINLLAGTHTIDATGSAVITADAASSVTGSGGLTKTGSGTVSLEGNNTYTGPTVVQAGTLGFKNSLPAASAITVDAAATLALGNLTLANNPALDIDGTLALTGPVMIAVPADSVIPGSFADVLQYGSITGAANLGSPYRNASFTVGANSASLDVLAGIPLTWTGAGGGTWDVDTTVSWKDGSDNPETFFWADSVTFDEAGALVQPAVTLSGELRPASVTVNSTTDYSFGGSGTIAGPSTLTKDGTSKLTIATDNTNTGTTTINAGTLEIGSGGTTGWMGGGDIVNHGALVFNRSNDFTVANLISGTGSLTKLGDGTMTVTGTNSHAGGTNLQAGTLGFGSGALGTTGNITFTGNSTLRWETGNTEDISSRLVMTDGVVSTLNTNGNDVTLASGFGGGSTGSLTKTGAGILELSGTNTYSGLTTITNAGGTLRITNKDAIGTGNVRIATAGANTGTLELALTGTNILNNTFNGFSSANNLGSGNAQILNTSGDNTITSDLTITGTGGNGLNVASNGGLLTLSGTITHTVATARTLNLGGSGNGVVSGNILNNAAVNLSLTKTGSGTWTLTGTNEYAGNTTVNGGTLVLGADNVLPDSTAVTLGNGTLNAAAFDDTAGTLDCSAAGTIHLGTGATLAFLNSSGVDWTGGTLTITGTFVPGNGVDPGVGTNPGSLRFGTTNAGLNAGQLASISAPGWTGFALDDYGYLTATVAAGYSSWASVNGAGTNLNDDHDNDGVTNGVEYFLGGPNGNTTGFTPLPGVDEEAGVLSVTWPKGDGYAGDYETHFVVETSATLSGPWTVETIAGGNITDTPNPGGSVKYTFPGGPAYSGRNFARLRVTGP